MRTKLQHALACLSQKVISLACILSFSYKLTILVCVVVSMGMCAFHLANAALLFIVGGEVLYVILILFTLHTSRHLSYLQLL
jgi:hypothetical protein